ncbi:hypothetical protein ABK040_010939 [Willaertia magna]
MNRALYPPFALLLLFLLFLLLTISLQENEFIFSKGINNNANHYNFNKDLETSTSTEWFDCSLFTDVKVNENTTNLPINSVPLDLFSTILAINDYHTKHNISIRTKAECTIVHLPIDYDNPETSPKIGIFIKRLRFNPNKHAKRALYFLSGGPGLASDIYEHNMALMINLLKEQFDLYTLDHRGVGRSERIGCNEAQGEAPGSDDGTTITNEELPNCVKSFKNKWGDYTKFFTSKHAAIDVVKLIQLINLKENNQQETFIYGCSYATVWVTRILRYLEQSNLFTSVIKGAILDAIMSTKGPKGFNGMYTLDQWDETQSLVGNEFLQMCNNVNRTKDATCQEKLKTNDPVKYMNNVLDLVYNNQTCIKFTELIDRNTLKINFGNLLMDQFGRILIPAILYRLNRCDVDIDIPVLLKFINYINLQTKANTNPTNLPLESDMLQYHVDFSEFWDNSKNLTEITTEFNEKIIMGTGDSITMTEKYEISDWPVYELDPYFYNETFTTQVPVLLMNGDLDPVTPLWSAIKQNENIKEANQKQLHDLIIVPYSVHAVILNSPTSYSSIPCGVELIVNFITMDEPNVFTMNKSCINYIQFNFTGSNYYNQLIFGVNDIYEDSIIEEQSDILVSLTILIGIVAGLLSFAVGVISVLCYLYFQTKEKLEKIILMKENDGLIVNDVDNDKDGVYNANKNNFGRRRKTTVVGPLIVVIKHLITDFYNKVYNNMKDL